MKIWIEFLLVLLSSVMLVGRSYIRETREQPQSVSCLSNLFKLGLVPCSPSLPRPRLLAKLANMNMPFRKINLFSPSLTDWRLSFLLNLTDSFAKCLSNIFLHLKSRWLLYCCCTFHLYQSFDQFGMLQISLESDNDGLTDYRQMTNL